MNLISNKQKTVASSSWPLHGRFQAVQHFKSELLFPAWAALRGAVGLEFLQLKLMFYKPVYNCSFLFSRGP